ncbi:(Na+)-NQR maturation NqrM [Marinimicrobium sp. ABcell2]|uniref:(Na+)-NQR maturation NqrM n=1 Tax=Marinimicrobium sp. ABcell2 TaxID=3069751 RepID=UPI0027B6299E|nr:(Na+)-NQR maturation NqrM [Marinimicrobium sp. ABcell2]MDQ2075596.1 (Na+)-NQR maturation NqrM [Marinimicrobium sp. ABcell2]
MLLVTLLVMLLVVTAMSVGVIFGRKPIAGSCGGVGKALDEEDYVCELCGNDENKCSEINAEAAAPEVKQDLSYEVGAEPDSTSRRS